MTQHDEGTRQGSRRAMNWLFQEHVGELCAKHEITRSQCQRPTQAWAGREISEICIPPIRSAISYATALHEIGHIVGPHQRSRESMVRERWAWRWAKSQALIWTPA